MTAKIIDGKVLAKQVREHVANGIQQRKAQHLRPPKLVVVLIGNDPASTIYVRNKELACKEVGIISQLMYLSCKTTQQELIDLINQLNNDASVDGILIQSPLPKHIKEHEIVEYISPDKDVDGFHPCNIGRLAVRHPTLRPCTPYGIIELLRFTKKPIRGSHCVIVGASNIVGRPMALELLLEGATITMTHRFTENLPYFVKQADIIIAAAGKPALIKGAWIKEGAVVIDVGITRLPDGSLTGDIEFDEAKKRASWITPVPGGVGPMTVAKLLENTLLAANRRDHVNVKSADE